MGFDIINTLKKEKGLTNAQLSNLSGVTLSTIDKITSGFNTNPKLDTLQALCRVLGCTLDDFMDSPPQAAKAPSTVSDEGLQIAKAYDALDAHGKSLTRLVISEEQKRVGEQVKQPEPVPSPTPVIAFPKPQKKTSHGGIVTIEVYEEPSAAGLGNYVSDAPASHLEQYPEEVIHTQTDYGVIISGTSMTPKYPDKAVAFVRSTQVVEPGEVGIFLLDGQTYIKQLHVDPDTGKVLLHSLNPEFSDIEVSPYADFRPLGKVLGGYDPTAKKAIWK